MTVGELIEKLRDTDQNKEIVAQVVALDGTGWICQLEINDVDRMRLVQVRLSHPSLDTMPVVKR